MSAPETPDSAPFDRAPSDTEPADRELGIRLDPPPLPPVATAQRVLVIGTDYAPEDSGIAPYTTGIAEHLATTAQGVTVLTAVPRTRDGQVSAPYRRRLWIADPAWSRPDGPRVIRLRHYVPTRPGILRRSLAELSFLVGSYRAGRSLDVDLVVGVTPGAAGAAAAALLARRHRARLITLVQAVDPVGSATVGSAAVGSAAVGSATVGSATVGSAAVGSGGRRRGATIAGALERFALRRSDEVAVAAESFRPVILAAGVPEHRLHLLPNWTRTRSTGESRQSAREALGWPPDRFTVVHAGHLGPRQDLGVAIVAARELNHLSESVHGHTRHGAGQGPQGGPLADWDRAVLAGAIELVVVGDGPARAALEQLAFGLDNVRFCDPVDDETLPLVLAAADVLVITEPPVTPDTTTPGLLASYLNAGRPILAAVAAAGATAGELRRTQGAGVRIDPGDPQALASALLALQSAPPERGVMGRAALRYAKAQLGRTASLRRLDLIIDAALSGPPEVLTACKSPINSALPPARVNGPGSVVGRSAGPTDRDARRGQ